MTAPTPAAPPPPAPVTAGRSARRPSWWQRHAPILGLAWINGAFHAASYRRQVVQATWSSPAPVLTLDELETALDAALQALAFSGQEVFLVLEHEQFQHQPEQAPAFSEAATRAYLKGRVARLEQEREPMLWVSQRTSSQRNEASVLLHLLTASTYSGINGLMRARRLDLTRIVPLALPLQLLIDQDAEARDQPVLLAAPAGSSTIVVASRPGQPLLFTRSILAPWEGDPARVAIEVNRSLLYAKQQFGAAIDRVRLLGPVTPAFEAELQTRCGAGKHISTVPSTPFDCLQQVARISPRHPVNLVAGYLSAKLRHRLARRVMTALAVLALSWAGLGAFLDVQAWALEQERLESLRLAEPALREELARLQLRNAEAERRLAVLAHAEALRELPVPSGFLAQVATLLPADARLTQWQVRRREDASGWIVRLEGMIEGDEESSRERIQIMERQLSRGVYRARFPAATRAFGLVATDGAGALPVIRFVLEGGLLED